ncbi:MAG: NfeD family protein [Planctomycetota bacterium]|jgi:membrane-bound serine protease (ClpP class)
MKSTLRKIAIVLPCLLLLWGAVIAEEFSNAPAETPGAKAAVIVCKDMIDNGLYKSIRRRTQIALDNGAEYLIYEISTYGGLVSSADDISKYFLDASKEAHTVAYITTEAISAGAMISVHCQDIIMLENATIGDCAPVVLIPSQKLEDVEREKTESFIRVAFDRAAKANNYPRALLRAMVTMRIEVYRVKNIQTGENEFFESVELSNKDPNIYDLNNKEIVVESDKLLTLIAPDALEYGIARAVVKDRAEALEFLARRDSVTFIDKPMVLETLWSEEMVRWINSPAVMAVLVMLAMLGVYIEFNTPGVGLPGLVAVICVVIIIGSKYLAELANVMEIGLFVLGILLLLIEFLVLPGFGIAGFSGIVCILAGLLGMLFKNPPGDEWYKPWPQDAIAWSDFTWGVMGLAMGFAGFICLAWLLSKYLPRIQFLSGLILVPAVPRQSSEIPLSMTTPPESKTVSVKMGDSGEVVSILRPTGKAKFGDAIVDVVAEADFLDKGTKVEIIEIHGNRVVVKKIES